MPLVKTFNVVVFTAAFLLALLCIMGFRNKIDTLPTPGQDETIILVPSDRSIPMNPYLQAAVDRYKVFGESKNQWSEPFPMGVFGTLRLGHGNSGLMGPAVDGSVQPESGRWVTYADRPPFQSHHKAFMPNFSADGLRIYNSLGSSAVFEVFTYEPNHWDGMIGSVDRLEGFDPGADKYRSGYFRTLVWLHILPDDYESEFYTSELWERRPRDLQIPQEQWKDYPRVPCWVYSSIHENELSLKNDKDSPILWCGLD